MYCAGRLHQEKSSATTFALTARRKLEHTHTNKWNKLSGNRPAPLLFLFSPLPLLSSDADIASHCYLPLATPPPARYPRLAKNSSQELGSQQQQPPPPKSNPENWGVGLVESHSGCLVNCHF